MKRALKSLFWFVLANAYFYLVIWGYYQAYER